MIKKKKKQKLKQTKRTPKHSDTRVLLWCDITDHTFNVFLLCVPSHWWDAEFSIGILAWECCLLCILNNTAKSAARSALHFPLCRAAEGHVPLVTPESRFSVLSCRPAKWQSQIRAWSPGVSATARALAPIPKFIGNKPLGFGGPCVDSILFHGILGHTLYS